MSHPKGQILLAVIALVLTVLACGESETVVRTPTPDTPVSTTQEETTVSAPEEPAVIPEPTLPTLGTSRTNPAPVGSKITAEDLSITVVEVVRPADDIALSGNMFNNPAQGKEYIMARLSLECEKGADDICRFSSSDFKIVGNKGEITDAAWGIAGVEGDMGAGEEIFGDTTTSRVIFFEISPDDDGLIMIYEPWLSLSARKTFLALD